MAAASTVAVVVPSPATSEVLVATSRTICAPMFWKWSARSISFATVTPSLVTVGAPHDFSRTTLRPLGPSVTATASLRIWMPRRIWSRAAWWKLISFAAMEISSGCKADLSAGERGRECRQVAGTVKPLVTRRPMVYLTALPEGACMHALAALALLLAQADAGAASAPPPRGATAPGAGQVSGKVTLSGLPPKLAPLPVTRDIKICGTSKPDESLEVGQGGGVKNAVLWIVDGPKPARPEKIKVTLDQKQCEFMPHLVALPAGATLDIVNGDKLFHNVHAREGDRTVFNYAMPVPNHVIPKPLKQPGLLRITCDVHPWMRAWVDVLPTSAFAVTEEAGSYTISGVPPGKHTLRLWHERLGDKEQQVGVTAGGTATVDVQLTPR